MRYCSSIYLSDWFTLFHMFYLQQFLAAVKPKIHKNALHLFSSLPDIIKILNRNLKHFALFLRKKHKNDGILEHRRLHLTVLKQKLQYIFLGVKAQKPYAERTGFTGIPQQITGFLLGKTRSDSGEGKEILYISSI